jgi:hypothetical protein
VALTVTVRATVILARIASGRLRLPRGESDAPRGPRDRDSPLERPVPTLLGGRPRRSRSGYSRTTHTSAEPSAVSCSCTGWNRSYTPNQWGPVVDEHRGRQQLGGHIVDLAVTWAAPVEDQRHGKTLAAHRPGRDGGARISARAVDKASRPRAPGFGLHRADPSTDVAVECSPATAVIHPPSRSVVRGAVRGCRRIIHSSRWEGSPPWSERQVLRVPTGTSAG